MGTSIIFPIWSARSGVMGDYKHIPIVAIAERAERATIKKLTRAGVTMVLSDSDNHEFPFKCVVSLVANCGK